MMTLPAQTNGNRLLRNFRIAKNKNGKRLYVPKDTDNFLVWNFPDDYNYLADSPEVQEQILLMVSEGEPLTKIAEDLGLPRAVLYSYCDKDPDFEKRMAAAFRFRARGHYSKLEEAAETVDEKSARSARVKADIYKHLMAVDDRERFGQQTKVVGDPTQPVQFIIDTGIRREIASKDEQSGVVEAEVLRQGEPRAEQRLLAVDGEPQRDDGARTDERGASSEEGEPHLLGDSQGGNP